MTYDVWILQDGGLWTYHVFTEAEYRDYVAKHKRDYPMVALECMVYPINSNVDLSEE